MPEKVGAPNDVPPATFRLPAESRNPLTHGPCGGVEPESVAQRRYPSWLGSAASAMSGTSRWPSLGTPVPACQLGLENNVLAPPPAAESRLTVAVSFHAVSGMYCNAEPLLALLVELQ